MVSQPVQPKSQLTAVALAPVKESLPGRSRAVILVHGFRFGANGKEIDAAEMQSWQKPGSRLVRALAAHADVYSLSYAQDVAVAEVARSSRLRARVRGVRDRGYREVVLVGHSAGGLIVRQLVEDYPALGVTRGVQVGTPNMGAPGAEMLPIEQRHQAFLLSLTRKARRAWLKERSGKSIPADMEFVCVVGRTDRAGDLLIPCASQWPADLQAQRIPVVCRSTVHIAQMSDRKCVQCLVEVIQQPAPRLSTSEVAKMRRLLFR